MGLKDWFFGAKRDRDNKITFKAGTRPAIILEDLCDGNVHSGLSVCQMLKTHNGDRELRRVRRRLSALGIPFVTYWLHGKNGRKYKATLIERAHREAARKLLGVQHG